MAKQEFIKIKNKRYRLSAIKRYEPFVHEGSNSPFGIYVYFSMQGESNRSYHVWEEIFDRDNTLLLLDEAFGV